MSKKDRLENETPVEENKMVTVYATKSNISINGKFIKQGGSAEITPEEAKTIKASRLAKMVEFK